MHRSKPTRLYFTFIATISLAISVNASLPFFDDRSGADSGAQEVEYDIYALINRERVRRRMNLLIWDDRLASIARAYSRNMAVHNFFDHADRQGRMVQDRIQQARIRKWSKVGENLFWVENTDRYASLAVRKWMDSPTHRANVLDREWTTTGIGVWQSGNGRIYVTQVFLAD